MRKNTIDATFEYLGLDREDFSEQLQANITDYERIAAQLKKQPPDFSGASLDVDNETDYAASMRELRSIFEMPRARVSQIFERAGVVGKSENDQWGVNLTALALADGTTKPISPALHRRRRVVVNYNHLLNQIADRLALQIFEETLLPLQYFLENDWLKLKMENA